MKIYVSLTTISSRIKNIRYVIDSILNQTRKVDAVKLFISSEPFLFDKGIAESDIPDDLKMLRDSGMIEIIYTKNIGPYRKLIPLLKEKQNEDCVIITADDDVVYPNDWTERLLGASEKNPRSVISFRNRYIEIGENRDIKGYRSWPLMTRDFCLKNQNKIIENKIFPTGIGGILYKPSFFNDIVFDEKFLEICPFNDDIWFRFSLIANEVGSEAVFFDSDGVEFYNIADESAINLHKINFDMSHEQNNDKQIREALDYIKNKYHVDVTKLIVNDKRHISISGIDPRIETLPGSIWGITTFFNPVGYKNKYENYKIFRENTRRQGLKLLAVELAFENRPFELRAADADLIIRIRGSNKNLMWQKEAMINIGIANLPDSCDKFVWIDCDLVFQNDNWVEETSKLLEKYKVVQPFSLAILTKKGEMIKDINVDNLPFGNTEGTKRYGNAYTRSKDNDRSGHPGFAWAARRKVFQNLNLYDKLIIGSADVIISDSFFSPRINLRTESNSAEMIEDQSDWWRKSYSVVNRSVSYSEGNVFHLWHGESKDRRYIERRYILKDMDFQPKTEIQKNRFGIWQWSTKKTAIIKYVASYFILRKEDDSIKSNSIVLRLYFNINRLIDGHMFKMLKVKKDMFLGKVGSILKKKYPKIYTYLVNRKPVWAEPLDI